ncbi:hypothetical protein ABSL23_01440 [Halobacterium sp. NMX12-1]|uniref:Uncharacterized protein n=1 Tax=Halobacterium sp. NMX12-1 TaxID=3166650 RepID=A0AAU8CDL1_9EURY
MDADVQYARRVTRRALDKSRNPNDESGKILNRIARSYGEDPIREFIRMTVQKDKPTPKAATYVFGDGSVGQQLSIAVRQIENEIG